MPTLPKITPTGQREWTNRHLNFRQSLDGLYDMTNAGGQTKIAGYNAMTGVIQAFIRQAIADGTNVRALGSGWSLSRVAATEGRLLNTKGLNWIFDLSDASIAPQYAGAREHLLFAQCGASIQEINRHLEAKKQCLRTSGASNGQTIAGALSTGTHGSAFDFGAMPEYVVGLHLITGPDTHIWLERASYPVVSEQLAARLNTKIVRDDALFDAALVSFGSFGFMHGVLLETEARYLLECHRRRLPYDANMRLLLETLQFNSGVHLPHGAARPFHFQVVLNPYDLEQGVYVTAHYKRPDEDKGFWDDFGPGDDAPAIIGKLGDVLPRLVPAAVNLLVREQYKPYSDKWGTPGMVFSNTTTFGKVLSAAVGIPLSAVNLATDVLLELNRTEGPFNGIFAFRYVKSTTATLGFTQFQPVTCILELDGVDSTRNRDFFRQCWAALDALQIPYTFHWGKINEATPDRLSRAYGERVNAWKTARGRLLPAESIAVFNNAQLREWGLDEVVMPANEDAA